MSVFKELQTIKDREPGSLGVNRQRLKILFGLLASVYFLGKPNSTFAQRTRGQLGRTFAKKATVQFGNYNEEVDIPPQFDFNQLIRDCDGISRLLKTQPKEMSEILDSIIKRNDVEGARRIADKIGLNEKNFVSQGGGFLHLIVVAIVLCILLCNPKKAH